jgi:hypothetical protein
VLAIKMIRKIWPEVVCAGAAGPWNGHRESVARRSAARPHKPQLLQIHILPGPIQYLCVFAGQEMNLEAVFFFFIFFY